jgi:DivIVA protein.
MATLDRYYFNSLNLEPVKRKYYDISSVDSVLLDIRTKAETLNKENEELKASVKAKDTELQSLREELREAEKRKNELNDAVLEARARYKEIMDRANSDAANIRHEALEEKQIMEERARRRQEYAVEKISEICGRMRESHTAQIEELNLMFQQFLCGLEEEDAPIDLSRKIGRIAKEVREIDEKESDTSI